MSQNLDEIKIKQNKSWLICLGVTAVCLSFLLLFVFQNCASSLDLASQDSPSFTNELDFAYDTEVDTIAYMSCSELNSDYNARALFSFRVGAHSGNSGVRLTKAYLSATEYFTPSQRANALAESEVNSNAILQLSVRRRNDLQSVLTTSDNDSFSENEDYTNILTSLDSSPIVERLVALKENQRIRYLLGVSGLNGRFLEGSLRPMKSEQAASDVRNYLRNDAMLTLTYADALTTGSTTARSPNPKDRQKAYGKGYQVDFRKGPRISSGDTISRQYRIAVPRVLNSIREVDLQKRSPVAANLRPWACEARYTFIIVRPEDTAYCKKEADSVGALTASKRQTLAVVRRVLRSEDWWVDLNKNCVIPKQSNGFCYKRSTSSPSIGYNTTDCKIDNCPHYVSICLRQ